MKLRDAMLGPLGDALGGAAARVFSRRAARYHRYRGNRLDEDQEYAFGPGFRRQPAQVLTPFSVPEGSAVLLAMRLHARGLGQLRDPFVELRAPDGRSVRQYLERGVHGLRYINASALAGVSGVELLLSDLTLAPADAAWVTSSAGLREGPLLVFAPHPDDAELAAFGLYAGRPAWVVTVCAGEHGTHDYGGLFSNDVAGASLRGRLRVAESLAAPLTGGVPPSQIANLGYFDGSLHTMFFERRQPARSAVAESGDLRFFRSSSAGLLPERTEATWAGLVADLAHLMRVSTAACVAFPHAILDHHPDHACLGLAVLEALQQHEGPLPQLLSYAVHGPGGGVEASIHPVGARDGAVSLPPGKHGQMLFDGLLSVPLAADRMREKALALDHYRDLKDEEGPLPVEQTWLRVRRGLREVYRALVVYDVGLIRRFLRPNELFFTLDGASLAAHYARFEQHVRAHMAPR